MYRYTKQYNTLAKTKSVGAKRTIPDSIKIRAKYIGCLTMLFNPVVISWSCFSSFPNNWLIPEKSSKL